MQIYIHKGCGQKCFVLDHKFQIGEVMQSKHVIEPEGVKPGDAIMCMSCGQPVGPTAVYPAQD